MCSKVKYWFYHSKKNPSPRALHTSCTHLLWSPLCTRCFSAVHSPSVDCGAGSRIYGYWTPICLLVQLSCVQPPFGYHCVFCQVFRTAHFSTNSTLRAQLATQTRNITCSYWLLKLRKSRALIGYSNSKHLMFWLALKLRTSCVPIGYSNLEHFRPYTLQKQNYFPGNGYFRWSENPYSTFHLSFYLWLINQ